MSVVLSPSFVVNEADAYINDNNPLICYDNIVTISNLTASSADADFPVTNLANPATDLLWKGASAAAITVTVANSGNETIDFVGIAGHNFGSKAIAVKIQIDTGSGYTDYTSQYMPGDDGPLLFRLPVTPSAANIRIYMYAGDAAPEMAVVYVGRSMVVQRRLYVGHVPISMGRSVDVANGISESGNFLGSVIVGEVRETQVELQNLSPVWYRSYLDPFIQVCKSTPCFFAWRPGSYPNEVGYCWITNDPKPTNQRANGMMSITMQFRGIA